MRIIPGEIKINLLAAFCCGQENMDTLAMVVLSKHAIKKYTKAQQANLNSDQMGVINLKNLEKDS